MVPISLDSRPPANAGHCIPVLITEVNSGLMLTLPEIYEPPRLTKRTEEAAEFRQRGASSERVCREPSKKSQDWQVPAFQTQLSKAGLGDRPLEGSV